MKAVRKISDLTGLPYKQVLYGFMAMVFMFIMFGVGSSLLTNMLGVAYPAFRSFRALESDGADDDKQWLTYWVVFGTITIMDQFAGIILSFIPFYYVLKVSLLIWMFHPSTLGSTTLYDSFILPTIRQYQGTIDTFSDELEN